MPESSLYIIIQYNIKETSNILWLFALLILIRFFTGCFYLEKILVAEGRKNDRLSALGLWTAIFGCVFLLFLAFPHEVKAGVVSGLSLCVDGVIPSLFPFAVLSSFFIKTEFTKWVSRPFSGISKVLYRTRGEVFALWLTGLVAGFPIGAKTAAGMYRSGTLSKREAEVGAAFSNGPSPAFVIAFCGAFFDTPLAGIMLFCTLALSSIICGAVVCRIFGSGWVFRSERLTQSLNSSVLSSFTGACISGWESVNTVCSFVIFFSALLSLGEGLMKDFLNNSVRVAIFRGIFELTAGISALGEGIPSIYWRFVLSAFLLSFSGLCANMQAICFLKDAILDIRPYLLGRGVMVVVCTCLAFLVGFLL